MKVVITGGAGFLGQRLAGLILAKGSIAGGTVDKVILADQCGPEVLTPALRDDPRVVYYPLDMRDNTAVQGLVADPEVKSVFHLASMMSGEGEVNFDQCLEVNLHGAERILNAVRGRNDPTIRVVFTSSTAVFQPDEAGHVEDGTKPLPLTTYGMTKAMVEMLINDMSRRGFFDGRTARLPTVIVRPGLPNSAASSCFSGIFREPLQGVACELPLPLDTRHPVQGYRAIVEGILHMHDLDAGRLGFDRAVTLPAFSASLAEMQAAVTAVAARLGRPLGPITVRVRPEVQKIVSGWAQSLANTRARALGFPELASLEEAAVHFAEDYLA